MSYQKTEAGVVITLTDEQYDELLLMLGYATGAMSNDDPNGWPLYRALRFVNEINDGNPNWMPYEVKS